MNLILWVVLFALIGLGKYAIGEIKQNHKTKGIALLIVTIALMIAWLALKGHISRNITY
jgi:tryptophan-rich sensory protein